jgi:hypothetical protein
MLLIGITGKAGAGKDTVGEILRDRYGFILTSFAWPIKQAISVIIDEPPGRWGNRKWKEEIYPLLGVSPRYMAQTMGTEWGRTLIDYNIWVKLALRRLEGSAFPNGAITDVRFDNEAEMIREQGVIVHVHREQCDKMDNPDHASEGGVLWNTRDFHIHNNGTLTDLNEETGVIVDMILEQQRKADEKVQSNITSAA